MHIPCQLSIFSSLFPSHHCHDKENQVVLRVMGNDTEEMTQRSDIEKKEAEVTDMKVHNSAGKNVS